MVSEPDKNNLVYQLKYLVFTGFECETQSIKDSRGSAIHGEFYPAGLSPRHVGQFLGILGEEV